MKVATPIQAKLQQLMAEAEMLEQMKRDIETVAEFRKMIVKEANVQ